MTSEDGLDRGLRGALRGRAARGACPGEPVMLAFYRGALSEADSETVREHLGECASCVALAGEAREFVEAMDGEVDRAASGRPPRRATRWLAAAAALLLAAIAGFWMTRQRPAVPAPSSPPRAAQETPLRPSDSWRDLPVEAAAYPLAPEDELVFRSDAPGETDFADAMDPYGRGDYAAAESRLARYLETHPGRAEAGFYRGVSLLMLGRPAAARPLLASAVASRRVPAGEARWYLALALLKSGDAAAALGELDAVAASGGPRGAEAARLAGEVRRELGSR